MTSINRVKMVVRIESRFAIAVTWGLNNNNFDWSHFNKTSNRKILLAWRCVLVSPRMPSSKLPSSLLSSRSVLLAEILPCRLGFLTRHFVSSYLEHPNHWIIVCWQPPNAVEALRIAAAGKVQVTFASKPLSKLTKWVLHLASLGFIAVDWCSRLQDLRRYEQGPDRWPHCSYYVNILSCNFFGALCILSRELGEKGIIEM
jgi:hypothetical protein